MAAVLPKHLNHEHRGEGRGEREDKPGQELHLRKRPLASNECACPRGNHGELLEKEKKTGYSLRLAAWPFLH